MRRTALVGHTGFVGGNIAAQHRFTDLYNSSNIHEASRGSFDLVVFSAAKAEKWRANGDPVSDAAHIDSLMGILAGINAERLVLISTVDVYPTPIGVDEDSPISEEGLHPYGLHRLRLERFVEQRFESAHVLRLPGLFGPGLKKNVIYDLLNQNNVDQINPRGVFQYYSLEHIWRDIERAISAEIPVLNVATGPIATSRLAEEVFGVDLGSGPADAPAPRYDFRSVHAAAWGGAAGYLYGAEAVLAEMSAFVERQRP